ncbi:histidine phosphatase family protein [Oerskovia sp. NPDC060338]|uniref:histidine phosphatase family protein n=1 Tax=Oerskovia sp. NPDC060338 TaxID=3347100 RepID=UPI003662764C
MYLARHGAADAFGELTAAGRRQANLLGERLARVPVTAVWHSPLPRAVASAHELARHVPHAVLAEAPELVDHVPHVPAPAETPAPWVGFFDGYDDAEASAGRRTADVHEVLVTHDYPVAWLVRHAMDAPEARWLGLSSANAALTVIEYRTSLPPALVLFNDMAHLPVELRWTGFPGPARP